MNLSRILCLLAVLFMSQVVYGQSQSPSIEIDALLDSYTEQPGIAVVVIDGDELIYQKVAGLANLDYDIPNSDSTVFDIGALAMHVTAACILQLESDDKLSTADPIHKYLEDWPRYNEGELTINHLLHHSSGLRDYINAINFKGESLEMAYSGEDAMQFIRAQQVLGFEPGDRYEYSNSNYLLLGEIVKRVSGMPLDSFAQQYFFEPLAMNHTRFLTDAKQVVKNRAIAYHQNSPDDPYRTQHYRQNTAIGDGRLLTSLGDLIKWNSNLDNNRVGPPKLFDHLTHRAYLNNGEQMTYGRGLEAGSEYGFIFYGHNGYWGGFSSFLLKFPSPELSVIVMSNNSGISAPQMAYRIASFYLENKEPKEIEEQSDRTKSNNRISVDLDSYVGTYFCRQTGYVREIKIKNDTLMYWISADYTRKLAALNSQEFEVIAAPIYTLRFGTKEGNRTFDFIMDGSTRYQYELFAEDDSNVLSINNLSGRYYASDLDVYYDLDVESDQLIVNIDGTEFMRYALLGGNIFISDSGHHGYMEFESSGMGFELNDYSMQKVNFAKVDPLQSF